MSTVVDRSIPTARHASDAVLVLRDDCLKLGDDDKKIRALDHVNLQMGAGELVAIIGPSGVGKSSLLAVAGALASPIPGTVEVKGTDIGSLRGQGALAEFHLTHIGFVFQSGNLIPALTAADQLRLAHRIAHQRGRSRDFDPQQLLDAIDIGHRASHRPGKLSGGERQHVSIARALVNDPAVLLVDEPTAALDRRRSQDIVALLAGQCHERGVAGVLVTHDHDILHHCDRVLEMVDERLGPRA